MRTLALVLAALACLLSVSADDTMTPLLPGLLNAAGPDGSLLLRGYDPVFMKPKGEIAGYHYTNLWNDNNVWVDPANGMTYSKPDEISEITSIPGAETSKDLEVFTTFSSYLKFRQSMSWEGFDLFFIAFSHGTTSGYVKEALNNSRNMLGIGSHYVTTTKMGMYPTFVLMDEMKGGTQVDTAFVKSQAALPTTDEELAASPDAYQLFIQQFGTHYAESAVYGGSLQVMITLNQTTASKYGDSWASEQMSIGLDLVFLSFGFSHGKNSTKGSLSYEFQKNSQVVLISYGGNPALVGNKQYGDWASTVNDNPVPINVTYTPLTEVFLDPAKAALMKEATKTYLTTNPKDTGSSCAQAPGTTLAGTNTPSRRLGAFAMSWDDILNSKRGDTKGESEQSTAAKDVATTSVPVANIPGLDTGIGRAYNAKTGIVGLPVSQFSYNQGKVWLDEVTNKYYRIPDGLLFESIPSACFEETYTALTNASSVWSFLAKETGFSIGLSYDGITVGLSFAHQMAELQSLLANYTKSLALARRKYVTYSLQYGSATTAMNPELQSMINMLGDTIGPEYKTLIDYWGTHYIERSDFGGWCNFTVTYDKTYLNDHTYKEASTQIGLSIGYMFDNIGINVDFGFGFGHASGKVDKKFSLSSNASYACGGGDVTSSGLLGKGDYTRWSESIQNAPALIPGSTQLRPLSNLVYKPKQRALLEQYITGYLSAK